MSEGKNSVWPAVVLPTAAFVGTVVVFAWLLVGFWKDVGVWARRDLRSQAELAAENLREPLETQNFRELTEFHRLLEAKEMILRVRSARGGWVFHGGYKGATVEEYVPCGDYLVGVAIPESRVYEPFYGALGGFVVAVLVGILGMFVVFFVLYRQRVRIRELKRQEEFRRAFIADVSHEIKTPLTGILGAVDMLEGDSPLVAMIRRESVRLNALVQSILDLSRLEREGATVRRVPTELVGLLREIAEKYGCLCAATGETVVTCDAQLVVRAVSNLVENARRHSGTDDIAVSLETSSDGATIVVEDHGIGIPPEHRARVFERFYRVDAARSSESGGAGLGLAIVREIARLHGGDVVCLPAKPKGARFELTLKGTFAASRFLI